jgi:molecular chaperone DnaK (HSP70)
MNKMSSEELREMIREILLSDESMNEYDALYPKKEQWQEASKELRAHLVDLLKNIENDEYQEGISKIDNVIDKLKDWKLKIQKFI